MFRIDEDTNVWIFLAPIIILTLLLCYAVWKNMGKASALKITMQEKELVVKEMEAIKGRYRDTSSNVRGSEQLTMRAELALDECRQQVLQLQDELTLQSLEAPAEGGPQ